MNNKSPLQKSTFKRKLRLLLNTIAIVILLYARAIAQTETLVQAVEAEKGVLAGVSTASSVAGYSGTGYVTGFDGTGDKLTVTVSVPAKATYKLIIRFNSVSGSKTQNLIINNGQSSKITFPKTTTYSDLDAGKYVLNEGNNTITIVSDWGYMDFDKFSIYTTAKNTYNIDANLVDPNANEATKNLYSFMVSQFGKKIISGQTSDNYDDIKTVTQNAPMLRAFDFQPYTNGYAYLWKDGAHTFGWEERGITNEAINWYNSTDKKGIVSFQWHWHSPSGAVPGKNTFYTDQTNFDVSKAVVPGHPEYTLILQDIDSIASQLKKLEKAGVPVVWRPLHEAGGTWFWWGAKGPEACKKLYDILYDRLMNYHNIHNLIWTWSTPEHDWYPGNSKIDIVGYDSYPGAFSYDPQASAFNNLYVMTEGKKLIAMTENGPIPDPNDCLSLDVPWSYFMSWSSLVHDQNSKQHIIDVYRNLKVLSFGTNYDSTTIEEPVDPVDPPTAIDPEIYSRLKVYPNPVHEYLSIDGIQTSGFHLVNVEGRTVLSSENSAERIDITALNAGFYILNLKYKNQIIRKKVIIEK